MIRSVLLCALLAATATALTAQTASQSDPYEGVSNPPPDSTITVAVPQTAPAAKPLPKPRAGTPMVTLPGQPPVVPVAAATTQPQPTSVDPSENFPASNPDGDIVQVAPDQPATTVHPVLNRRTQAYDPDGDIVHPAPPPPGTLGEGTTIRVRLLQRLSTAFNEKGDTFRSQVASDVMQGGQVLIPAGSEIDGHVARVSMGSFGGHGSMLLRPDTVILPDGSRYKLYAQLMATPGSNTEVGASEGKIVPGSRLKRDSIEYGGAVGAGAVTGAALAGPGGALVGGIVGAGAITAHLLVNHPQAHLETGTVLIFALTEPLALRAESADAAQPDGVIRQ